MSTEDQPTVVGGDTPVHPTSLGDLPGRVLDGRYDIVRKIGAGSMGDVYEATDRLGGRRVAVKVLKPERAHRGVFLQRFLREARSASMVRHPNVVEIVDVGEAAEGPVYFVMEYLDGEDLAAVLRREQRMPWPRCRSILRQLADALGTAHARGIVHRDIKPSNILLLPGQGPGVDLVKLVDFGVAKLGVDLVSKQLTSADDVVGTVLYMSPEQTQGLPAEPRSDIYALGVVAYEMATGRVPFPGRDIFKVMAFHLRQQPRPPRELLPSLPPEVDDIILCALQKRPEDRFASMQALANALAGGSVSSAPKAATAPRPESLFPEQDADPHAPTMMSPADVVALDEEGPTPVQDPDSFDEKPTAYFRAPTGVAPRGLTTIAPHPQPPSPGPRQTTPRVAPATPQPVPREHTQVASEPIAPFIPMPAPPVAATSSPHHPAQYATTSQPTPSQPTPYVPFSGETERASPMAFDTLDRPPHRGSKSGVWAALTLLLFVVAGLIIAFATR